MNKRKIVIGICVLFCLSIIVGATVNLYFGTINTELKVKQPITIDGNSANEPITHELEVWGGDSTEVKHKIRNDGKIDANISQITTGLTEGIDLIITYQNGTVVSFPFILLGKDKATLILIYSTNMNLIEGTYLIQTRFSCEKRR